MTGLPTDRLADLITTRVREIVGDEWEKPPVGRPHVLPLPTAVIAVLFGLRHNMPDEVVGEVFGCSQATITRYREILRPVLRWVTRPEVDQRLEQTRREGVLVDGWVAQLTDADRRGLTPLFWTHVAPYGEVKLDMTRRLVLSTAGTRL